MFSTFIHRWLRVPYTLHVRELRRVKKPRATLLFIHGIGSTGAEWDKVIEKLPEDVSLMTIDLLGFGESPRPSWAKYNANTQAKSVVATLVRSGIRRKLIIVGHSLGALVAVEVAKRYPLAVKSLILCSPPFYKTDDLNPLLNADEILRRIYAQVEGRAEALVKFSTLATKLKLVNAAFNVTDDNVDSYIATLQSTIINQTTLDDAKGINKPMTIIYGSLDPFVIDKNIKELADTNPQVTRAKILIGHEIIGRYVPAVVREIMKRL